MKRIFIALICLAPMVTSAQPNLKVTNLNFDYQDTHGKGAATEFTVELEKIFEDFKLKVYGSMEAEYEIKNAPALLKEAQSIRLNAFNLGLNERLNISLVDAAFISPDETMELQSFSLDCARDLTTTVVKDQIINGCLQQLRLKSTKLTTQSILEEGILSALSNSGVKISGLDVKVNSGKYEFSAEVKAQMSGKAKSNGQLSYDSSKKLLTIKINEIKFSVLNVTSQVFKELKKKESESMRVEKPYLYLTIK